MPVNTCTFTGTILGAGGSVLQGATVTFDLVGPGGAREIATGELVNRTQITATTDSNGAFSQAVVRTDEITYPGEATAGSMYWRIECASAYLKTYLRSAAASVNIVTSTSLITSEQVFAVIVDGDSQYLSFTNSQTLTASQKLLSITNQGMNLTASKLLGQASSGGTGLPVSITLGTNLSMSGTTLNAVDSATGTVTSVSVTTAAGVSGSVATATTTPAITVTLGAISPTSVAASGAVTGSNLSGTNTGDQTITLTGDVTGSGTGSFAATLVAAQPSAHTWAAVQTFTLAPVFTDASGTRTALGLVIGTNVQAYDVDLTTWAGITPATGIGTFLATPTSANLLAAVTDETGTGALVFATAPTFTTSINCAADTFNAFAFATTLLTLGGTGASASTHFPSTLDATSSVTGAIRTSGGISAAKALNVGTTATIGGTLLIADGAAATPGVAFSADTNTGIWRSGADALDFTTGGVTKWQISSGGTLTSSYTYNVNAGIFQGSSGGVTQPTFTFGSSADTNTGMYRISEGVIGFTSNGVLQYTVGTAGVTVAGTLGVTGAATITGITTTNGRIRALRAVTGTDTITTADDVVVGNHATTAFTITLPTLASSAKSCFTIKNKGAAVVTLDGNGAETIDGAADVSLSQYASVTVINDTTQWLIL